MRKFLLIFACVTIILMLFMAIFAPFVAPFDPTAINLEAKFLDPSQTYILGTDHLGRDIFSRLIYGARVSFFCVFLTLFLVLVFGGVAGGVAGFMGGKIDQALMRICDLFFGIPTIVLALFLVSIFGSGTLNIIIAIAITHWAWYARFIRSIVLSLKNKEYVLVSKLCGASGVANFKQNMLRVIASQCIILATLDIGHIMLHISGLSFLGLGVKAPDAEWGIMISDAKEFLFSAPHLIYYPGIALFLCVASFNIAGDYLRDRLDSGDFEELSNA
ncbi:nickel ABC transporter permease subunit NikC [Campylobacter mucosalis]|uniref:nickel ABC transporter permease subunit NikC n=1 Tax=Campylobacter mucosalis TaxID=202 RepID=UPI001470710A|nr:nickel ABC transporter permease subunit NikC [Campylobacter mucosalis]